MCVNILYNHSKVIEQTNQIENEHSPKNAKCYRAHLSHTESDYVHVLPVISIMPEWIHPNSIYEVNTKMRPKFEAKNIFTRQMCHTYNQMIYIYRPAILHVYPSL